MEPFASDVLAAAARTAGLAPSIHNTQPWSWRVRGSVADLFADTRRQLRVADADRRLLTISCGAAVHHARLSLAADGVAAEVNLLPAAGNPLHLARITVAGTFPASDSDRLMRDAIRHRRTDRRQLLAEPVDGKAIRAMGLLAMDYGAGLQLLERDDVVRLAEAIMLAQRDQIADPATRRELDTWSGNRRPHQAGIPDANIPTAPSQTSVPTRDFGHVGTLPVTERGDTSTTYAILYGVDDKPASWLRSGQALSAIWLYATMYGIAVLPLSAPVEEFVTRLMLSQLLGGLGSVQLPLRFGIADPASPPPPRTPRLPAEATVTVLG